MGLRATAPSWFPPGYPQALQREEARLLAELGLECDEVWSCPARVTVRTETPRKGARGLSASARPRHEAQRTPAGWPHRAPRPADSPSPAGSLGQRRDTRAPGPGSAPAPPDVRRKGVASSSPTSSVPRPGPRRAQKRRPPGPAPAALCVTLPKRMAPCPPSASSQEPRRSPEWGRPVPKAPRQRSVSLFLRQCRQVSPAPGDALLRARSAERLLYLASGSRSAYLDAIAVPRTLKELSGLAPSAVPGLSRAALYRHLRGYLLTEDQRRAHGYPFPHPEQPGRAVLFTTGGRGPPEPEDALLRTCCRCGSQYRVCGPRQECRYHWAKPRPQPGPGGWQVRHPCCSNAPGSPGCQVAQQHVHLGREGNLEGFRKTVPKGLCHHAHPGIYALDCEMSYTTHGLELTRATLVDEDMCVVYDTFVRPDHDIVDYNTRFSGVTEADLAGTSTTLRDVQGFLLSVLSADTILVGHSLQSDLLAVKIIHDAVVDTSVLFPHRRGLPFKRSLRDLAADVLGEAIQDGAHGHCSRQDASACLRLVLWKVQEDAQSGPDPHSTGPATSAPGRLSWTLPALGPGLVWPERLRS
ncbi:exonuclease GOR-like [Ctenodactylus gundi]